MFPWAAHALQPHTGTALRGRTGLWGLGPASGTLSLCAHSELYLLLRIPMPFYVFIPVMLSLLVADSGMDGAARCKSHHVSTFLFPVNWFLKRKQTLDTEFLVLFCGTRAVALTVTWR